MTLEREKYLAGISDKERAMRAYIKKVKELIKRHKRLVLYGDIQILQQDGKHDIVDGKISLAVAKQILAMLKKQLPQRLPEEKRCSDG